MRARETRQAKPRPVRLQHVYTRLYTVPSVHNTKSSRAQHNWGARWSHTGRCCVHLPPLPATGQPFSTKYTGYWSAFKPPSVHGKTYTCSVCCMKIRGKCDEPCHGPQHISLINTSYGKFMGVHCSLVRVP